MPEASTAPQFPGWASIITQNGRYERAALLHPYDRDIAANLSWFRQKTGLSQSPQTRE